MMCFMCSNTFFRDESQTMIKQSFAGIIWNWFEGYGFRELQFQG